MILDNHGLTISIVIGHDDAIQIIDRLNQKDQTIESLIDALEGACMALNRFGCKRNVHGSKEDRAYENAMRVAMEKRVEL